VNKALCEILGYSESQLLGKTVKDVSHPDDRDLTDAERMRIRRGEIDSARFEKRYLRGDGAVIWCEIAIALVRDVFGVPQYEVAIFDDITERKQQEAALRAAHEELKRSNHELEQFAYVASHDLQEPLRMVASYTQLLERRYESKLDTNAREFMAYIVDGATRMKQLIEDLLAYSRVGTKGAEFQPAPVEAALRRALYNLRTAIEEAGAVVTHDALPILPADEGQLAQLLQNLVGNALKFTRRGRVEIDCRIEDAYCVVAVSDTGIGIAPEHLAAVFEPFRQVDGSDRRRFGGVGLGLHIVRRLCGQLGAHVAVTSEPGRGSTFIVRFPLTGPTARAA
jgi:PAS domain S-box-containing protein